MSGTVNSARTRIIDDVYATGSTCNGTWVHLDWTLGCNVQRRRQKNKTRYSHCTCHLIRFVSDQTVSPKSHHHHHHHNKSSNTRSHLLRSSLKNIRHQHPCRPLKEVPDGSRNTGVASVSPFLSLHTHNFPQQSDERQPWLPASPALSATRYELCCQGGCETFNFASKTFIMYANE